MKTDVLVVVPLRLSSVRVPNKVLALIGRDALCVRSVSRVKKAFADMPTVQVIAAVDDEKVQKLLEAKVPSVKVVMTDPMLPSGTDRVLAAAQAYMGAEFSQLKGVINVQGDMPFVGSKALQQVAKVFLENPGNILAKANILTLSEPFGRELELQKVPKAKALQEAHKAYMGQAAVKVLVDREQFALYFSRYPIPYSRVALKKPKVSKAKKGAKKVTDEVVPFEAQLHLGVYGYAPKALVEFCAQSPTNLELFEGLEQLRAMWLGQKIFVLEAEKEAHSSFRGIDVPADLSWARKSYKKF